MRQLRAFVTSALIVIGGTAASAGPDEDVLGKAAGCFNYVHIQRVALFLGARTLSQ